MVIVVVNGYLVQVNDIPGRTHYLYYEGDQLIALVTYNTHSYLLFYLYMQTWSMLYDIVLSPVFYLCMRTWSMGTYDIDLSLSLCASVNIIMPLDQGSIFSIQKTNSYIYVHIRNTVIL